MWQGECCHVIMFSCASFFLVPETCTEERSSIRCAFQVPVSGGTRFLSVCHHHNTAYRTFRTQDTSDPRHVGPKMWIRSVLGPKCLVTIIIHRSPPLGDNLLPLMHRKIQAVMHGTLISASVSALTARANYLYIHCSHHRARWIMASLTFPRNCFIMHVTVCTMLMSTERRSNLQHVLGGNSIRLGVEQTWDLH